MIKIEFDLPENSKLNTNIKEILKTVISDKQLKEIENKGGKIQINIILKKSKRKAKKKIEPKITKNIVKELAEIKDYPDKILRRLDEFNKVDLLQICRYINQPIRTKAKTIEIKNEIVRYFQSEKIWKGISGNKNNNE